MPNFSKTKIITIIGICLLSLYWAIPSLLQRDLPFFPKHRVNLGLDLQGGSHLLLQADLDYYIDEQLTILTDALRKELRENNIKLAGSLQQKNKRISLVLRNPEQHKQLKEIIQSLNSTVDIEFNNQGRMQIYFADVALAKLKDKVLKQSLEVVRRRIDETGTREPIIQTQGNNSILVQVPGLANPEELKEILGKTAKMTFHLVAPIATKSGDRNTIQVPDYQDGILYTLEKEILLGGEMLTEAIASYENGEPTVRFHFNSQGAKKFAEITRDNMGKSLAVVLDNKVITAPRINGVIPNGSGIITGNFTIQEANEIAMLLRAGSLPTPMEVTEERVVGPSLGRDSITAGTMACTIGLGLIIIFMLCVYKLFGLFADIALMFNLVTIVAMLAMMGTTLTLPGIAGIVLTLGMAVDANVLIFERIKEELANGQSNQKAVDNGFANALSTIIDSNLTTLIIAFLLYAISIGSIRGFAVTLSIGILASMFSAISLTRLLIASYLYFVHPNKLSLV